MTFMGHFNIKGQRVIEHVSLKYCIISLVLLSSSIYNCLLLSRCNWDCDKNETKQNKHTHIQKQPVSVIYLTFFFSKKCTPMWLKQWLYSVLQDFAKDIMGLNETTY